MCDNCNENCLPINLCIDPADLPGGEGYVPDLRTGEEVLWPVRRNGKQVYAKLLDFGAFPAPYGLRSKTHNVPDIEWCQISWDHSSIRSSTDANRVVLGMASSPSITPGNPPWRFMIDKNSVQVNMTSNTDYRAWDNIEICILYTKSTDEPVQP